MQSWKKYHSFLYSQTLSNHKNRTLILFLVRYFRCQNGNQVKLLEIKDHKCETAEVICDYIDSALHRIYHKKILDFVRSIQILTLDGLTEQALTRSSRSCKVP